MTDNGFIRKIDEKQMTIRAEAEKDIYLRQEYQLPHNSYEYTQRIMEAFFDDRINDILDMFMNIEAAEIPVKIEDAESREWLPGRLAEDTDRNAKNLFISIIVTAVNQLYVGDRSNYEFITTLGDAGVREIERAETYNEMVFVMVATCRQLIHQFRKVQCETNYHPLIGQAKDYIFKNLHHKIVIGDMAKALKVSPSYLSQVFRRKEGSTVQEYILNERIARAKELLALTDRPIGEICGDLGFTSQSSLASI